MAKDRSLVRASDIGAWTFCRRAWWLSNVQKVPHQNPDVLQRGNEVHFNHGRQVERSVQLARWGLILIGVGLLCFLLLALIWILIG